MEDSRQILIAVCEPLRIVRAGLRAFLEREVDLAVVGEAGDGADLLQLVTRLRPDVLIMEPSLLDPPAELLLSAVMSVHAPLRVLVLALPQEIPKAIALLEAGAAGCILKSDRPEELLRGIRAMVEGDLAVSSAVALALLKRQTLQPPPAEPLTEREKEVYDLLFAGLSNKDIAQQLYLSVRTVEVHLRSIFSKLGVRSRLEAVARGLQSSPESSKRSR